MSSNDKKTTLPNPLHDWEGAVQNAFSEGVSSPQVESLIRDFPVPPHALDAFLKNPLLKKHFSLMGKNLHEGLSHEDLMKIWNASIRHGPHLHNEELDDDIMSHKGWSPSEEEEKIRHVGGIFWNNFEEGPQAHHFAAIQSMQSKERLGYYPEISLRLEHLKERRDGSSRIYQNIIPHFGDYAKKAQEAILKDNSIVKKNLRGKVYVKLYRGVNGQYAKKLAEAANHDPYEHSVEDRKLTVPMAQMASWTTSPKMAQTFAKMDQEFPQRYQATMTSWFPIESILHSGFHYLYPGHSHSYPDENEIVVNHPLRSIVISTKNMEFPGLGPHGNFVLSKPKKIKPKPFKKSDIFNFIDVQGLLFKSIKEVDLSEVALFEQNGLIKAMQPPKNIGEMHPLDPTLVARQHPNTKQIAWHTIPMVARKTDKDILDRTPAFLSKMSQSHSRILNRAINDVSNSPTRHFRIGWDKSPQKQVLRARHIKALLSNQGSARMDLSDPNKVVLIMDRHRGIPGETTSWTLTEQGGFDQGGFYDESFRRNEDGVSKRADGWADEIHGWKEPMGYVPARVYPFDPELWHRRHSGESGGIFGVDGTSQNLFDLKKAPTELDEEDAKYVGDQDSYNFSHKDLYVTSNKLKNGLYHHVFKRKKEQNHFIHVISKSENYLDPTLATLRGELNKEGLKINESYVGKDHSGKNYGKAVYAAALLHHGALVSDNLISQNAQKVWQHMKEKMPGVSVEYGNKNYENQHKAKIEGDKAALQNYILHEGFSKTNTLNKALPVNELHGLGYRFKVLQPTAQREAYAVTAYHKGKKVGHVLYSINPRLGSLPEKAHEKGFHEVWKAHVNEDHRGKGLYQAMLNIGAEHVKTLGSKGLMSEGYQRSGEATHAWDRTASFAIDPGSSTSIKRLPYRANYFIQKNSEGQKVKLVHYSHLPGLTRLDPKFYGTGHRGEEHQRGASPRTFYYLEGTQPEDVVVQRAPYKYTAEIPDDHKIYDMGSDPHGIIARAVERAIGRQINPGILTPEDAEDAIRDAGYHGFYNSKHPTVPNAVAYFHPLDVKEEPDMKKSFFQEEDILEKVGDGYKKLMASGIALLHPVKIGNKEISNDGIPFHTTIKVFHPEEDRFQQAHDIARSINMVPPDPSKTTIKPMIFKDRFGDDVHVLELGGDAERIVEHNSAFKQMGFPVKYSFRPHITIDEDTYHKVLRDRPQMASDLGISFGNAELRHGHESVRKYPPLE